MIQHYSVLIMEDEKHQQETLLQLLSSFPNLRVDGIGSSVAEGADLIRQLKPDLVFLDVMLGHQTSFDLLGQLDSITFDIVFTTSFEEYAVKAFRLSAVDYLLKPIASDALADAVEKFIQRRSNRSGSVHLETLLENLKSSQSSNVKIALPTLTGYLFLKVSEIIRCEADNTYTTFFCNDKRKVVVSKTLKECEQILSDHGFFRVHNSHLVNMEYIREYVRGEGGIVKMADGTQVDVSRRKKEEFLIKLKNQNSKSF